jgi:hypothetical protein
MLVARMKSLGQFLMGYPKTEEDPAPALSAFDGVVADATKTFNRPQLLARLNFQTICTFKKTLQECDVAELVEYIFDVSGPGSDGAAADEAGVQFTGDLTKLDIKTAAAKNVLAKAVLEAVFLPLIEGREQCPVTAVALLAALRKWVQVGAKLSGDAGMIGGYLARQFRSDRGISAEYLPVLRLALVAQVVPALVMMRGAEEIPEEMMNLLRPASRRKINNAFRDMNRALARRAGI